VDRHVGPS